MDCTEEVLEDSSELFVSISVAYFVDPYEIA